ncbi:interleukin-17d [Biomphalaria glabrata]|nr:hypothetical protein BgiMline_019101 [Biomphalaria glabrata]
MFAFSFFAGLASEALSISPSSKLHSHLTRDGSDDLARNNSSLPELNTTLSRSSRQNDCELPSNWMIQLLEVNANIQTPVFNGNFPSLNLFTNVFDKDQNLTCPPRKGSWWPGSTKNLKSNCPWKYQIFDLGPSFYPNHLIYADCLCRSCVDANIRGCIAERVLVKVLRKDFLSNTDIMKRNQQ